MIAVAAAVVAIMVWRLLQLWEAAACVRTERSAHRRPRPARVRRRPGRSGAGRVLVAVYGTFALAAGARAAVQLSTKFAEAPVAYLLSAFAAVVYIVATVGLVRGGRGGRRPRRSRSASSWSASWSSARSPSRPGRVPGRDGVVGVTGSGYGFVPLVLPVLGLLLLRRTGRASRPIATRVVVPLLAESAPRQSRPRPWRTAPDLAKDRSSSSVERG